MCGIAGVWGSSDKSRLSSMLDCLVHRGPDDSGMYTQASPKVAMGMRRLSIIDIEEGGQPIYNEDGTVVVVFNGEIYNYPELRDELHKLGHDFSTETDTEILVHLWEENGPGMLSKLNGMFAFSLWDANTDTLFLARDRLGIKPLYVSHTDGEVKWASNLQALLQAGVSPVLDENSVYDYFRARASTAPNTMLKGARKLRPGHYLQIKDGDITESRYWRPPTTTVGYSREEIVTEIRRLLEESVSRRLRADVPVGAFLSGGLDSTAIVALMSRQRDDLQTFSIGFEGQDNDESSEAEFVASQFDTNHRTISVDLSSVETFERLMQYNGEPVADPAMIPTLLLAEDARQDVKVVLTGEGADELFGGYQHYEVMQKHRQLAKYLPRSLFILPRKAAELGIGDKYLRYAAGLESGRSLLLTIAQDYRREPSAYLDIEPSENIEQAIDDVFQSARPELAHRQMMMDLEHNLSERLLYKVDITTMATSLEARVPFLDHNLVEFTSRIPSDMRTDGRYKPLLREAVADIVPERTLSRSKQGFNPPVSEWFQQDSAVVDRWLSMERIKATPCLNAEAINQLHNERISGNSDNGQVLWKVMTYIAWYHVIVEPHL